MSKHKITSYFETNSPKKCRTSNIDGNAKKTMIEMQTQMPDTQIPTSTSSIEELSSSNQVSLVDSTDIGNFINETADDFTKSLIVKRSNIPASNFIFPFSTHIKKGKAEKRYLRVNHFEKYSWLEYSNIKHGLFCKTCVLFLTSSLGGMHKTQPLKTLVTEPLKKYAKLLGKDGALDVHNNTIYHKNAALQAIDFLTTYSEPSKEIINILHSKRNEEIQENRARLRPIIDSIVFLGRQNIPLRGHRDDGREMFGGQNESVINCGNFKEILKFRVDSGDHLLENHLRTSHSNATYISNVIQNEIIECCRQEILHVIMLEANEAKYYSVIFDETTDISNASQITLNIRYVFKDQVLERFIGFIDCHKYIFDKEKGHLSDINEEDESVEHSEPKITGELLGETVVNILKDFGFNLDTCVGIGTDGCSVMVSTARGAVQQIQKYAKNAIHCPCSNHALNLSISKSSTVQYVRNCIGVIKEVISFFHVSPKRNFVLKNNLSHRTTLSGLCETRWIERHDSVLQFKNSLLEIVDALNEISQWEDNISSTKFNILVSAICNCDFILTIFVLSSTLSVTFPISKLLQGKDEDIFTASKYIKDIISTLKKYRSNCDEEFNSIFRESENILKTLNVEVKLPRLYGRQKYRSNITNIDKPEDYYRINLYIPLLDSILEDLNSRFINKENKNLLALMQLVPSNIVQVKDDKALKPAIEYMSAIINEQTLFKHLPMDNIQSELNIWYSMWCRHKLEGTIDIS